MTRETLPPLAWLWLASVILGAALFFAAPAKADPASNYAAIAAPAVCSTLDAYPTLPGVEGVLQAVQRDSGFTVEQTARVVVLSVTSRCPRHLWLLQEFADVYAPRQAVTA
ncbi:DUF732 domain-containing protein [Mycobacterium heckeshornense]|uniref:DUF732 domain-containing protein n=1 Tax=Mycobacterium heckeshornense TaxID=110505 RepID=UPI0008FD8C25|nr:DUF732 domain-containing protein [Mycobacterium heckeshornense]PIJ36762.1 DUF732 domain-containing protein [Mycobacterium heckeshornense]PIJ36813.1 DUF732 domain-containing protein [Mycobacterium heckeshornense]